MSWLPKGERPKEPGDYFVRWQGSKLSPRAVRIKHLDQHAAAGMYVFFPGDGIEERLADCPYDAASFAPATPPPEWDLVEAIRNDPMENARSVDVNHQVSLDWIGGYEAGCAACEEIARAYLAREEKP